MATSIIGKKNWKLNRSREGERRYTLVTTVLASSITVGPAEVLGTSGLPQIGDTWNIDGDVDTWAWCTAEADITPKVIGEGNVEWKVEQAFSTVPLERCQDTEITDPLLEPDKVGGSFTRSREEVYRNRDGSLILSSSLEPFSGAEVEFDKVAPTVTISQNVSDLELPLLSEQINTLNDDVLWDMPARTIKLSGIIWSRKVYGTCGYYYTRSFEFEVNTDTWDKLIDDVGTRVLNGEWDVVTGNWVVLEVAPGVPADKTNPNHFIQAKDKNDEVLDRVILNGEGTPATEIDPAGTGTDGLGPATVSVYHYLESDFLELGIPTTL